MTESHQAFTFFQACKFLSLDASRALYGDLGLSLNEPHAFQLGLRKLVRATSRDRSEVDVVREYRLLIDNRAELLKHTVGQADGQVLLLWAADVYDQDANAWTALKTAFLHLASIYRRSGDDRINLTVYRVDAYSQFWEAVQGYDYRLVEESYRVDALSSWDSEMLERALEGEVCPFNPFQITAELCISLDRFQTFWMRVCIDLPTAVHDALTEEMRKAPLNSLPESINAAKFRRRLPSTSRG